MQFHKYINNTTILYSGLSSLGASFPIWAHDSGKSILGYCIKFNCESPLWHARIWCKCHKAIISGSNFRLFSREHFKSFNLLDPRDP